MWLMNHQQDKKTWRHRTVCTLLFLGNLEKSKMGSWHIVQAKPFLHMRNYLLDIKALVKDFYDLPECCSFSVQYQESDLWLALAMVTLFSKCYAQRVFFSEAVDGNLKSACDALMTHVEVTGVCSVALTHLFVRCLCHGDVGSCKRV